MSLHALDDIDDAIDATRSFLWPFDLGRWGRLALVVFFLGGTGSANPTQFTGDFGGTGPTSPGGEQMPASPPSIGDVEIAILAVAVAAVLLLVLGFALVGAVMEFVFVESLRNENVRIRRYWSERWKQGLRLFGFRLVVGLLSLAVIGAVLVASLAPYLSGSGELSLGLLFLAIPVFFVVAVVSGLVNGFTTGFVVPVMISEDSTVLAAWRRFWPTLKAEWKEYGAYVVMRFVLQIAVGILVGIVTLLGVIIIAIPFGVFGAIGFGLVSVVEPLGWAIVAIAALLFVLAVLTLTLFLNVPVQTFLRYYALLLLGDTNESFDLIAERRAAIRE
jgi:hypothetical protein